MYFKPDRRLLKNNHAKKLNYAEQPFIKFLLGLQCINKDSNTDS